MRKEIENMKGNIFDKIRKASNKYIEYMLACDDVAKEAQKHIDWYNENTPSEDEEYERGCLSIALIVAIIFIALTVVILSYEL